MIINRRQVIAGAAAVAAVPLATEVKAEENYKDKYWEAQAQIDSLERELDEMYAHARIMQGKENEETNDFFSVTD